MSIVVLKRKSKMYQYPISGKHNLGFALNGTLRNIGEVGPTNLANSVTRTPFRGDEPMGNGGCKSKKIMYGGANRGSCPEHYPLVISNSGSCCVNDPNIVKVSTKNTKGMLSSRYSKTNYYDQRDIRCCNNIVKTPLNPGGQGEYIYKLKSVKSINSGEFTNYGRCKKEYFNETGAISHDTYLHTLHRRKHCFPATHFHLRRFDDELSQNSSIIQYY